MRALGATPVDYRSEDVPARVRELAPDGVAAVFDHVGGPGIDDSWRMLARGGTLVSYGTAATKDVPGNPRLPVLKLLAKLTVWNVLPNGRTRHVLQPLGGRAVPPARFRAQLRDDLTHVLRCSRRRDHAADRGAVPARARPPRRCASPRAAAIRGRSADP